MKSAKLNWKAFLPAAFILAFLAVGIIGFSFGMQHSFGEGSILALSEAKVDKCVIDYGEIECVGGRAVIPFYNAGEKEIRSVHVFVPVKNGTDIFNVIQPLSAKEAKSLTISDCSAIINSNVIRVKWCCEQCYETEMNSPNKKVTVKTWN